jgi:hypothetical protein
MYNLLVKHPKIFATLQQIHRLKLQVSKHFQVRSGRGKEEEIDSHACHIKISGAQQQQMNVVYYTNTSKK